MSIPMSGTSDNTHKNMQVGAGVFIENFAYDTIKTDTELETAVKEAADTKDWLGGTTGGKSFGNSAEFWSPTLDGNKIDFKGLMQKQKTSVTLGTTLVEITPENLQRILSSTQAKKDGNVTRIRERLNIDPDLDYMKSLSWIGNMANGSYIIITLFNAININGATWDSADNAENGIPVTFTGTNSDFNDIEFAPYEITIIEKTATAPETFGSTAQRTTKTIK